MSELKEKILMIITGCVTGFANGFFGGGGGMIVVPMLVLLLKFKTKIAHATALAIILPVTIVSGILYFIFGKFNLGSGIPVSIGVSLGGVLGAILLKKMKNKFIIKLFALVMLIAGIKLLFF